MPILERKCNSCHNARKSKGELVMSTREGLLKGGKSGPLLTAGGAAGSLLLDRIHLPLDDEEHMPPSGKTQLTEEEIRLLELWIEQDAAFDTQVAALDPKNELFQLASLRFAERADADSYDFSPASNATIEKLNHAFRSVMKLARDSPALDARVFSRAEYSSEVLRELLEVKTQLVSLNLSEMPVSDADLGIVAQFENLNRLNLNFTDITGAGLDRLAEMPHLQHLSVSGTWVDEIGVRTLLQKQLGLKTLYLWDTGLTDTELEQLERDFPNVRLLSGKEIKEMDILQLNLPGLASSPIFADSMYLHLGHPIRDVTIRYTLDGSEPDSVSSPVYKEGEILLTEAKVVKAKAYKEGWFGSELATIQVYQNRFNPDTVYLLSRLNRVHPANGALTFFDGEMGTFNANSPAWANNWAGFLNNDMELLLEYRKPVPVSQVAMRVLVEPETVIFPPASLEVWAGNEPDRLQLLGRIQPKQPSALGKPYIQDVSIAVPTFIGRYFKIVAKPVGKIPEWSPRKGRSALLLVDEMFVN
nr:c-type cytochrome domain-containing protein [Lunatimonas salinarum]